MKHLSFNNSEKILIRKACEGYIYYLENSTDDVMTEKDKKEMKKRKLSKKIVKSATKKALVLLNDIYTEPEILIHLQPEFIGWFVRGLMSPVTMDNDKPEMKKIILKIKRTLKQNKPKTRR